MLLLQGSVVRKKRVRTTLPTPVSWIGICERLPELEPRGGSVLDGAVDDALQLPAEVERVGGHQLRHEDRHEVFPGIDPEDRRSRATPVIIARADRAGSHLAQRHREAE